MQSDISLENEFINDISKTCRVICCIGQKGSGKSYFMNSFIKYSISTNLFESFHLVLPCYKNEQNDSYRYLNNQNAYIYKTLTEKTIEVVIKNAKGRTLFVIDDATSFSNGLDSDNFKHLVTTTRHLNICVLLCIHGSKKCITPIIRMNLDYLFLMKVSNMLLLRQLYEEYFGIIFNKFNSFLQYYNNTMKIKYNAILVSNQMNDIDATIANWDFVKYSDDIELQAYNGKMKNVVQKQKATNKPEPTRYHNLMNYFKK